MKKEGQEHPAREHMTKKRVRTIALCTALAGTLSVGGILKFAFRSTDPEEIRKTLLFMGLEYTEANVELLRGLENGECLYCDIYGVCGVIYIDYVFEEFLRAFDTRPPMNRIATAG